MDVLGKFCRPKTSSAFFHHEYVFLAVLVINVISYIENAIWLVHFLPNLGRNFFKSKDPC